MSDVTPYILPASQTTPNDLAAHFLESNQRRQVELDREAREKSAHDLAMSKYLGKQIDASDFATGMDLDKTINKLSSDGMQQITEGIRSGMNDADLMALASQTAAKMNQYHQVGSQLKANINSVVDPLKTDKGTNTGAMKSLMYHDQQYNEDGTVKPLSEINTDGENALNYVTEHHADKIFNGNPMMQAFDAAQTHEANANETSKVNGIDIAQKYKYTLRPGQRLIPNPDGSNRVGTELVDIPITGADGKQTTVKGVSDAVLGEYAKQWSSLPYMRNIAVQDAAKHGQTLPDAESKDLYLRTITIPNILDGMPAKKDFVSNLYDNTGAINQADAAEHLNISKALLTIAQQKLTDKENGAAGGKEDFAGAIKNIQSNNPDYLTGDDAPSGLFTSIKNSLTGGDNLKGFKDVTDKFPGGSVYTNRTQKDKTGTDIKTTYNKVYYNPETKQFATQDKGASGAYIQPDADKWVRQISTANGVPISKLVKEVGSVSNTSPAPAKISPKKPGKWDQYQVK